MGINLKPSRKVTTLDVKSDTEFPVEGVLSMLETLNGTINTNYVCIDFTAVKPNRFSPDSLELLLISLPNQNKRNYLFAFPDKMVPFVESQVRNYVNSIGYPGKPNYLAGDKKSVTMIINQRNRE